MTDAVKLEASWSSATEAVRQAQTILIVTHMKPDGDAFGSMLGLGNALREMGKAVDCAVDDGLFDYMAFLPNSDTVQVELTEGEWDLMISVDASDAERTGLVGEYGRAHSKAVINLDHHVTNTMFGDHQVVDANAVSATEVIFRWLNTMSVEISPAVAVPLLTGLVTDTIGFRTPNVTTNTLKIAQELMQAGASLTEITQRALDNRTFLEVNLWKYALASMQMYEAGVLVAQVTQEDLKKSGLAEMTDAGLVSLLIKVEEAMIAAVFKEQDDGTVSMSMRAKPGFNVSDVALSLGGGGHTQAAGATVEGELEDVRKETIKRLIQAAKSGKLVIA